MGLTARLRAAAVRRPHVLIAAVPGHRDVRAAAERLLVDRGWPRAASPADADVLLVCGTLGPGMSAAIEVTWGGLPGPRARACATTAEGVAGALGVAQRQLADLSRQGEDARDRPAPPLGAADAADAPGTGSETDSTDMDMGLPGGLAMADRDDDRDGLRLDVLHLVLGPVLPGWPAGLRLTTVLQGDVLAGAEVELLDASAEPAMSGQWEAWDDLSRLLAAAGWQDGALCAQRARDGLLPAADAVRLVRRSRTLRWSLRGLPGPGSSDLLAYLGRRLDRAEGDAAPEPAVGPSELCAAVTGLDVGSAVMVVAAFGPHLRMPVTAGA